MKSLVSLLVSGILLALIYYQLEPEELLDVANGARSDWLAAGIALVIPTTVLTALRLRILAPTAQIGIAEATRLILAASSLNMILPSKMGDLAKAWFIRRRSDLSNWVSICLVLIEKGFDVLALLAWCLIGLIALSADGVLFAAGALAIAVAFCAGVALLLFPRLAVPILKRLGRMAPEEWGDLPSAWVYTHAYLFENGMRIWRVAALSLFIWLLHLTQIWMFIRSLNADVDLLNSLARIPLAILVGLAPVTVAGIGSRDAALILLFRDHFEVATGAALGLLCTLRYVFPALVGLPFVGRMTPPFKDEGRKGQETPKQI